MKFFEPSEDPAEGLGVLMLFRLIEEAVPAFFRGDRRILIARAPGRLDVMGGRAPASSSLVLQLPIAEAACLAIQQRDDDLVRLWSPCRDGSRTQMLSMRLHDLGLPGAPIGYDDARALFGGDPRDRWAGYMLGALLVLAREHRLHAARGADLLLHSDVPEGRGVASSSAVTVAALRAFALLHQIDLGALELARACQLVEQRVLAVPAPAADPMTVASAAAGELLALRGDTGELHARITVPMDLEFIGLETGPRAPISPPAAGPEPDASPDHARAEDFRRLLGGEPTPAHRRELGDLMFAAHDAYIAAGRGHPAADLVVREAQRRRDGGGAVFGAKATGAGGGGTVVLLGERGKVWYEALRIKKALLQATGHSGHIFRWSSPGTLAFGAIELRPTGGDGS